MGLDPISLASAATQTGIGLLQSVFGGGKAKKAQKQLENLQTPTYDYSKSINDYYNSALQNYNTNPYQSAQYNYATNAANRNTATGISALQDRRSAVGGVSRLAAINNDAALKAGMVAEQQKQQNLGRVGEAANMKTADDRYGFQINKIMPYQKQLQLLGMKAGAGSTQQNQGMQNVFGGLSNIGMLSANRNNNGTTQPIKLGAPPSWVADYQDPYYNERPQ